MNKLVYNRYTMTVKLYKSYNNWKFMYKQVEYTIRQIKVLDWISFVLNKDVIYIKIGFPTGVARNGKDYFAYICDWTYDSSESRIRLEGVIFKNFRSILKCPEFMETRMFCVTPALKDFHDLAFIDQIK